MTDMTGNSSSRQPNNVLIESRTALNLSHEKLAYLVRDKAREMSVQVGTLDSVARHIKRIEAGHVRDPSVVYRKLLCAVLKKTEAALFGVAYPYAASNSRASGEVGLFQIRNHKLIPAFIGADRAGKVLSALAMRSTMIHSIRCYQCPVGHPRGDVSADLWVWPFGVALFHLVEDVEFSNLAHFAVWHRRVYDELGKPNNKISLEIRDRRPVCYACKLCPPTDLVKTTYRHSSADSVCTAYTSPADGSYGVIGSRAR